MDGSMAIERNRVALTRIVASLAAMAGLAGFSPPLEPAEGVGEDGSARRGEAEAPAEPGEGSDRPLPIAATLPRHLWRAILRLLRPAEAAARRLIVASARGIVVPAPVPRGPRPKPVNPEPLLRSLGIAVVVPHAGLAAARRAKVEGGGGPEPQLSARRIPAFALFDPPRRPNLSKRRRHVPAHSAPRIMFPGITEPSRLPPPPSPDDPVDATRIGLRLAALAAALDDLPAQASRFARRKARLDAALAQPGHLVRRVSPLRSGPPPGGRLTRYDPACRDAASAQGRRRGIREVDRILAHAHALALYALESPDTS